MFNRSRTKILKTNISRSPTQNDLKTRISMHFKNQLLLLNYELCEVTISALALNGGWGL